MRTGPCGIGKAYKLRERKMVTIQINGYTVEIHHAWRGYWWAQIREWRHETLSYYTKRGIERGNGKALIDAIYEWIDAHP